MVVTVADLVVRLCWDTTPLAGTLISPSTPAGVSFTRQPPMRFAAGDRISIEIEGTCIPTNPAESA